MSLPLVLSPWSHKGKEYKMDSRFREKKELLGLLALLPHACGNGFILVVRSAKKFHTFCFDVFTVTTQTQRAVRIGLGGLTFLVRLFARPKR